MSAHGARPALRTLPQQHVPPAGRRWTARGTRRGGDQRSRLRPHGARMAAAVDYQVRQVLQQLRETVAADSRFVSGAGQRTVCNLIPICLLSSVTCARLRIRTSSDSIEASAVLRPPRPICRASQGAAQRWRVVAQDRKTPEQTLSIPHNHGHMGRVRTFAESGMPPAPGTLTVISSGCLQSHWHAMLEYP